MAFTNIKNSLRQLRFFGVFGMVVRKIAKWRRYKTMLLAVPNNDLVATLKKSQDFSPDDKLSLDRETILAHADAMLRDENIFFSFPYRTIGIDRPWEFDPIENKYWPRRHYTERKLHDKDTPKDVKIVFEINRFKDLPTLGQAAFLTNDERYAREVERRLLYWIEENPFANSVNWSSALEISIRLISWTATLLLLEKAGFNIADNPKIQRSVYEQACYLAADLGTDKVISTNHLIGEAAGYTLRPLCGNFKTIKRMQILHSTSLSERSSSKHSLMALPAKHRVGIISSSRIFLIWLAVLRHPKTNHSAKHFKRAFQQ